VRFDADTERLSIDYRLGADPRSSCRASTCAWFRGNLGLDPGHCVNHSSPGAPPPWTRPLAPPDRVHEFEAVLIKNLIENGRLDRRNPRRTGAASRLARFIGSAINS
jgi:hypothetical protein